MVKQKEDIKTHLHRVASSNLPIIPRKSWEYYVAILQPGIPLEKCEHADFLWMKVKGTTTVEKILTMHLKRTGRNSILMDGENGLTIDAKMDHIACYGLGVYAFWEIVKVERWWEYTVRPTDVTERLSATKDRNHKRSGEDTEYERSAARANPSTKTSSIATKEERGRGRPRQEQSLNMEAVEENRSDIVKRRRSEVDGEIDAVTKRRRNELDVKVEMMRLENENPPPIETLDNLAESTKVDLQHHDDYVVKKRRAVSTQSKRLGPNRYQEMLQRFEISWERQRQDIINRDPQFTRSRQSTQGIAHRSNENSRLQLEQEQEENAKIQRLEKETSRCLELFQRQFEEVKRRYPESNITLQHVDNWVHFKCGFCGIITGLKLGDHNQTTYFLEKHQNSKEHTEKYHEAEKKEMIKQSESKKHKTASTSDDIKCDDNIAKAVLAAVHEQYPGSKLRILNKIGIHIYCTDCPPYTSYDLDASLPGEEYNFFWKALKQHIRSTDHVEMVNDRRKNSEKVRGWEGENFKW